jgi:hypothetical protein
VSDVFSFKNKALFLLTAWLRELSYIASCRQFPDVDLWGRLSMGALITKTGRFPYHDIFSYTANGAPWIDHEWLSGLLFYQVLSFTGEIGFIIFYILLLLGINGLLFFLHNRVYKVSPLWSMYGLIATVDLYSHGFISTIRCQVFSFLLFLFFIVILEGIRLKQWRIHWLLLLLPIGIIWGNLHGGIAMGLLLLLCYGFGSIITSRQWKKGIPFIATFLGILIGLGFCNPYGWPYLSFLWHAWTLPRKHIGEWSPLQLDSWYYSGLQLLIIGALSVLFIQVGQWCTQKKLTESFIPSLAVLVFCTMVCKAIRMEAFFAFTCIAYAPIILINLKDYWKGSSFYRFGLKHLSNKFKKTVQNKTLPSCDKAFTRTIPILISGLSLVSLIYMHVKMDLSRLILNDELTKIEQTQFRYPVGIVEALKKSRYHGNLMVHFDIGEFAYWTLYPQFKISLDGRYEEVYSEAQFLKNQYFYDKKAIGKAQNYAIHLAEEPVDYLLTLPNLPSTAVILADKRWKMLGGNDYFLVFANTVRVKNSDGLKELPMSLPLSIKSLRNYFPPQWISSK